MSQEITTFQQLLKYYYGPQMVRKDAPVLTTTTGVYNPVFGAQAFSQLNGEANAFSILPKRPWARSGWRAITADAGSSGDGGVSENGNIPATNKPNLAEISTKPTQVAHAFDVSAIHSGLVATADDNWGSMDHLRAYFANRHARAINEQLLYDADTLPSALPGSAGFESIDRVTLSTTAVTNLGITAGDEDMYSIDASSNSWFQPGVCDENSGTDRVLTESLITDALASLRSAGGRTNAILTGDDTYWRIVNLYNNQVRYTGTLTTDNQIQVGVNGVMTDEGMGAGVRVAKLYGIPLLTSQAVQQDTISRIYLLDTTENEGTGWPRLFIAMLYPTLYFESGMEAAMPNPFAINRFGTEGVFYTAGELICTFRKAQGSIRDLK